MSAFTKGGWHAVGAFVEHENDDIADICSCNPSDFGQGHLNRSYKEICANARLLAAAPEMLSLLIECDEAMDYMSEYDIPISLPDRVKTVIARAKGEK